MQIDITDEKLKLVFINKVGVNYKEKNIYEIVFSYNINIRGDEWDRCPSMGFPKAPKNADAVGLLTTDINLILAKDSNNYSYNDVIDGIIAMAYQDLAGLDQYPEDRLVFRYNMSLNEVTNLLIPHKLALIFEFEEQIIEDN